MHKSMSFLSLAVEAP